MTVSTFESYASQMAIASINVYRTHISPRKGFSCPHRLLHENESCSDYAKRVFTEQRLSTALQMTSQRFRDCKAAATMLSLQRAQGGCIVIPCCLPI